MVNVTFVDNAGNRHVVQAVAGDTLMIAARDNGMDGITADCGGLGACATCQVYIDRDWLERAGTMSEDERDMLELTNNILPTSRLSCQIVLDNTLDGLVATLPEIQS